MIPSYITLKYYFGNQNKLRETLKKDIKVPFITAEGCIYSIRFPNRPLFVAHMDTVGVCDMQKPITYTSKYMRRKNSGLGADDRAGVNLIMNHHQNINFLITRDEEIGRKGAKALAENEFFLKKLQKVSCIVQLDVSGFNIVRGAEHGYCNKDLMEDLKIVMPRVEDSVGSFSDLDSFMKFKPGINLGVGTKGQHSKKEKLIFSEFMYINNRIMHLNNTLIKEYTLNIPKIPKYDDYFNQDNEPFYKKVIPKYCDICGASSTNSIYLSEIYTELCPRCLSRLRAKLQKLPEEHFEK